MAKSFEEILLLIKQFKIGSVLIGTVLPNNNVLLDKEQTEDERILKNAIQELCEENEKLKAEIEELTENFNEADEELQSLHVKISTCASCCHHLG